MRPKAAGTVGEQADGYLGFVSGSADGATLTAAVNDINAGRANVYADTASKTGVTRDAAGQATGAHADRPRARRRPVLSSR